MAEEKVEVGKEVECPKCGHKFWHKIGHAVKSAAEAALEAGIMIATGGGPGVSR